MGKYTVHQIFSNIYLQYKKHNYQTKNIISTNVHQLKRSIFVLHQ